MDEQRASQGSDGSYDIKDSYDFVYKALSRELFIGNVYLRVYNDQPDFEISEAEAFCVALIDFVSYLVHNQNMEDADVHNTVDSSNSVIQTSECQTETDDDGSANEQLVLDDSTTVSDGQVAEKEELELVKNLRAALTSLQVTLLGCL